MVTKGLGGVCCWDADGCETILLHSGTPKGGGGCWPAAPPPSLDLKNTNFVDKISDVLCDLPFSKNQSLKPADD
jgi:hypothetical protein